MAGDLGLTELPMLEAPGGAEAVLPAASCIASDASSPDPEAAGADVPRAPEEVAGDDLDETERLGLAACGCASRTSTAPPS